MRAKILLVGRAKFVSHGLMAWLFLENGIPTDEMIEDGVL
jgi:hypothetical protein